MAKVNMNKMYIKIDSDKYSETGEICFIGKPIKASEVMLDGVCLRSEFNIGFAIHSPDLLYRLIEKIGGAKGKVVTSIMRKKDINNNVNATIKDLVGWSGCSSKTVMDTIKLLRENDMLKT